MRAPRFIRRTELGGLELVPAGNAAVLDRHDELQRLVRERLGGAIADLFAEPVVTRGNGPNPGSVSWYAAAPGEPHSFGALSAADRGPAEERLRRALAALEPGFRDPQLGPMLRAALMVPSLDDVLLLGDTPVLTGWGLAPAGAAARPSALAPYAPFLAAGPAPSPSAAASAAAAAAGAAAGAVAAATAAGAGRRWFSRGRGGAGGGDATGGGAPGGGEGGGGVGGGGAVPPGPPRPVPVASAPRGGVWTWWLLPFGVLFALAFLGVGFWLGWSLLAERLGSQTVTTSIIDERETRDLIDAQKKTNDALERQIAEARAALAKNVCTADAPVGLTPPPGATPVKPENLPQPPSGQPFNGSLGQLLEQAVVLVIGAGDEGIGMGTGFFVTPKLIVTNRHVVEKLVADKIFVTNKPLGGIKSAKLVAKTASSEFGEPDYALLEVEDAPPIQPLGLTRVANRLDDVVAAGYPTFVLAGDSQFRALLAGDASAIPEMVATNGLISAIQLLRENRPIIPNTASISAGNSGGPLVDRCGRVVGINTFGRINQEHADKINYAQKTDTLLEFLKSQNVAATELTGPCAAAAGATPAVQAPGGQGARGGAAAATPGAPRQGAPAPAAGPDRQGGAAPPAAAPDKPAEK
jgi:S1-C subfamily serine protease